MSTPGTGPGPVDPHVQVVRGAPDDVELAALVAGLVAAAAGQDEHGGEQAGTGTEAERAARARWTAGRLRGAAGAVRGRDAWRWSLHP